MKYIKLITLLSFLYSSTMLYAWGETGHRVIGEVATKNLKKKALKKILKLSNQESLASLSTFADEIKSDARYKKYYAWHFVNFNENEMYEDAVKNPEGDLYKAIEFCITTLQDKNTSKADQLFYLRLLIHFIGDLHQPLHVGHAHDKGGNDIKIKWFGEPSNLHRVWDSDLINFYNMSYTELTANLPFKNKNEISRIQSGTILDWVYESKKLANKVYSSVKVEENLYYSYPYVYLPIVKVQLQNGGLRLAKILNKIYAS